MTIRTEPPGATCTVTRGGTTLGMVDPTPGTLIVDHSDKDLTVTCRKPGWRETVGTIAAHYNGIGLRSLITGGAAAIVEEAATSTDFSYESGGTITLLPVR